MSSCLSVVIPAFNEEATLVAVTQKILAVPHLHEVVIVDDCSTDRTGDIAEELAQRFPQVKVLHHRTNRGKTEALKTGFAHTAGDVVIVQDADLEYDPSDIEHVIAPILANEADVVYGSRFMQTWNPGAARLFGYTAAETIGRPVTMLIVSISRAICA